MMLSRKPRPFGCKYSSLIGIGTWTPFHYWPKTKLKDYYILNQNYVGIVVVLTDLLANVDTFIVASAIDLIAEEHALIVFINNCKHILAK